ncbi:hypothetical protein CDAR_2551 [Caerostris darwini]|uniref:Uncharacterized protein n=1 Tax=Caerostris darwini TaxID=1538125 RepID=A0AAV4N1Y0_9ARAC|nr:hypothetical protein CDAR_2551 [Caerostris darwini]
MSSLCRRAYVDPIRWLCHPGPQTSIRLWISQPVRKPTKSHKSVSTTRARGFVGLTGTTPQRSMSLREANCRIHMDLGVSGPSLPNQSWAWWGRLVAGWDEHLS